MLDEEHSERDRVGSSQSAASMAVLVKTRVVPSADDAAVAAALSSANAARRTLGRQRSMTSFGGVHDGVADLVAQAMLDEEKVIELEMLPPTPAFPNGTRLSDEEDIAANPAACGMEDWRETIMLGGLVPFVAVRQFTNTSLDAAMFKRASPHCENDDCIALLNITTKEVAYITRHTLLDVIFRWKLGGGASSDAPTALQSIAATAVPTAMDQKREISRKLGKDVAPAITWFFQPTFTLPEDEVQYLQLQQPMDSGSEPMDIIFLRACCLYVHAAIHVTATGFMEYGGANSLPRTHTPQAEDDFMRAILDPRDIDRSPLHSIGYSLFAAEAGFDSKRAGGRMESSLRKECRTNAAAIHMILRAGRSNADANPLGTVRSISAQCVNFSSCVAFAAASLRGRPPPRLPKLPRWIIGRVLERLKDAVELLARSQTRIEWLTAFYRSLGAAHDVVLINFESHASIGLAAFKQAIHATSTMLKESLSKPASSRSPRPSSSSDAAAAASATAKSADALRPWYTLIPYTRRCEPLPGYLLAADRCTLRAINLLLEWTSSGEDPVAAKASGLDLCVLDGLGSKHAVYSAVAQSIQASFTLSAAELALHKPEGQRCVEPRSGRTDINSVVLLVDDYKGLLELPTVEMDDLRKKRVATLPRSMYNEEELLNWSYSRPTRYSDPLEFQRPGELEAVQTMAAHLRRYICVTDTSTAERAAREEQRFSAQMQQSTSVQPLSER